MTEFAVDYPSDEPAQVFEMSSEQRDNALKQSLQLAAASNPRALLDNLHDASLFHRSLQQSIQTLQQSGAAAIERPTARRPSSPLRREHLGIARLAISVDEARLPQRVVPSEDEKQRLNGLPEYRHARIERDKQPYDSSAQKLFLSQQIGNMARLWAADAASEPTRPELYIVPDL